MAPNSKATKNKQSSKQQTVPTRKTGLDKGNSQSRKKQNNANGRNSKSKSSCSGQCWRWLIGSIALLGLVIGSITYDTDVNGNGVFAKSATGQMLQRAGVLPHVERAWYLGMGSAARGYKWSEKNVLPHLKPCGQLLCDLTKMARVGTGNIYTSLKNYVNAKLPMAASFLERYVPGLPLQIEKTSESVKGFTVSMCDKFTEFFKARVLVGRFSPDNLSKALNETQNVAIRLYQQFQKKVDTYAKLK